MTPVKHSSELSPLFPRLGFGVGLRTAHYAHVLENRPSSVSWFEAVSENYLGLESGGFGGRPLAILEKIRANYPIVLHGVSLSIGSVDPLNTKYLTRLKRLASRIEPAWISDHLCWTGVEGENLHDLLPLPYTEEALNHVVARIRQAQDILERRLVIENVSSYVTYAHSEMTEWDFLAQVAGLADCGLLLDINNVYVSSVNHQFDPLAYLDAMPKERIAQFHLAGYSDHGTHLVDTHSRAVSEPVWNLYAQAVARFGDVSTLIEWDENLPEFAVLENEVATARDVQETTLAKFQPLKTKSRRRSEVDALDHH